MTFSSYHPFKNCFIFLRCILCAHFAVYLIFEQIPLIASHIEFLLQSLSYGKRETILILNKSTQFANCGKYVFFHFLHFWYRIAGISHKTSPNFLRILLEDHPATLQSKNDLAVLYKEQAHYEEAEKLLIEAIEGHRLKLGNTHPHTLESLNNLIDLYEARNKPEKAEEWRSKLPLQKPNEQ
ncbi:MAG: hypothetical protein A2168_04855 [Planctomycetes bacterium RBG_13_50_24]|nr:MAG: hypothetical protein A2168_04855 [Planctomycetes bacterium RBG_13_50_24]